MRTQDPGPGSAGVELTQCAEKIFPTKKTVPGNSDQAGNKYFDRPEVKAARLVKERGNGHKQTFYNLLSFAEAKLKC